MLTIKGKKQTKQLASDLLAVYLYENAKNHDLSVLPDEKLKKKVAENIKNYGFLAKRSEILILEGTDKIKRIAVFGLGKKNKVTDDTIRGALFQAVKKANELKVKTMISSVPVAEKYLAHAVEGALLSDYQFKGLYQKEDKSRAYTLNSLVFITTAISANRIINEASTIFSAVNRAKDLVNLPSNIVTPTYLEQEAKDIAKTSKKIQFKVLSEEDAEKEKMGSFLAVARGSQEPAKMIILRYNGNPKDKAVYGVIGKGITFDSGGISIKPAHGMAKMKTDMAGSAAALGVFRAVVALDLKVNLVTIVAAAENMPGGKAYRPGDIISASNGKTIEVTNTDAEGRLVLADALVYAQKLGVTKMIDIATLTGACIVALGDIRTAVMSNHKQWVGAYLEAADETGEKAWQLPMDEEYDELIKSDVCDMINANENRKAGSIVGGKFLEKFVKEGIEWIHLDIAGTSYMDSPSGYLHKHATAVPVRTIVNLLKREANKRK